MHNGNGGKRVCADVPRIRLLYIESRESAFGALVRAFSILKQ